MVFVEAGDVSRNKRQVDSRFRGNDGVVSAKTSAARRAAFFAALRETGNQTIAAERAKVSRSWVQLQRSTDPAFKADVAAAVAKAKAHFDKLRASGGGTRKPPRGWGHLDGEELVVKGTGGSGGGKRVQIARARLKQWTPGVEERFLATLAATCNVKAACAEVGMTAASAYAHRKRWPAFAARWDAAIEEGYARIELALIENGCNLFSSPECPPAAPMPDMKTADAIHLLHMHKHQVKGIGRRPGLPEREPTFEEVGAWFTRALEALARSERLSEAARKRAEADYARRRR
jgi:hypothetical protein